MLYRKFELNKDNSGNLLIKLKMLMKMNINISISNRH